MLAASPLATLECAAPDSPETLPHALMKVALLVAGVVLLCGLLEEALFSQAGFSTALYYLPETLGWWAGHLLAVALCTFCLAQSYLQRHGLGDDLNRRRLLLAYGLGSLLMYIAMALVYRFGFFWLFENVDIWGEGQLAGPLLLVLFGLLQFVVEIVLPLYLSLHLLAPKASGAVPVRRVSGSTLALCFAGVLLVVNVKLTGQVLQLLDMFGVDYGGGVWNQPIVLANAGLLALVCYGAARRAMPERVRGFNLGRLLLAVALTLLLYGFYAVLVIALMQQLILAGAVFWLLIALVVFGLLQLGLFWPLTLLGLRWGYRPQAA